MESSRYKYIKKKEYKLSNSWPLNREYEYEIRMKTKAQFDTVNEDKEIEQFIRDNPQVVEVANKGCENQGNVV